MQELKTKYPDCQWSAADWNFWLKAATKAAKLKCKNDYVVQTDKDTGRSIVFIVHKDTTGTVDKKSKWGEGVHTCVSVFEGSQTGNMIIPWRSEVIAKQDVHTFLKRYHSISLFTGSMGDDATIQVIKETVGSDNVIKFPRAKKRLNSSKDCPKVEEWPKVKGENVYSRSFQFEPIICKDDSTKNQKILEGIQYVQRQNKSCLVLLNTIEECEQFAHFLQENGISDETIQIYDDARDEADTTKNTLRPEPETVVARAKTPKMITIGTAVAGRGVNFRDVQYNFIAKPGLNRVLAQKKGRVARDTDLGMVYEIYSVTDLHVITKRLPPKRKVESSYPRENFLINKHIIQEIGKSLESDTLDRIAKKNISS